MLSHKPTPIREDGVGILDIIDVGRSIRDPTGYQALQQRTGDRYV